MDTLSHVRRVRRFIESQQRKALKRKMDGYNSLARAGGGRGLGVDSDALSPDTLHDISQQMYENYKSNIRERFFRRKNSKQELAQEVISPEIREFWSHKIHKFSSPAELRELRLDSLARTLVTKWCEAEGYDPDKHSSEYVIRPEHEVCHSQHGVKSNCECVHVF